MSFNDLAWINIVGAGIIAVVVAVLLITLLLWYFRRR